MPLANPLPEMSISSPFGNRTLDGVTSFHPGIDLRAAEGTEVVAVDDGVVANSYESQGATTTEGGPPWSYGNRIIVNHASGLQSTYNRLSERRVNTGDKVTKGDVIALSGNTGYSFGPHLHFEIILNGTPVDPTKYVGAAAVEAPDSSDASDSLAGKVIFLGMLGAVATLATWAMIRGA